jgi:N-acetylmuramoyl-L-alanine amidase
VEPCFITNPKEERLVQEEPFLREVAAAMVRALDRFFAGQEGGPATATP